MVEVWRARCPALTPSPPLQAVRMPLLHNNVNIRMTIAVTMQLVEVEYQVCKRGLLCTLVSTFFPLFPLIFLLTKGHRGSAMDHLFGVISSSSGSSDDSDDDIASDSDAASDGDDRKQPQRSSQEPTLPPITADSHPQQASDTTTPNESFELPPGDVSFPQVKQQNGLFNVLLLAAISCVYLLPFSALRPLKLVGRYQRNAKKLISLQSSAYPTLARTTRLRKMNTPQVST